MSNTQTVVTRSARICLGIGLLACCLAAVPAALAQYPSKSRSARTARRSCWRITRTAAL